MSSISSFENPLSFFQDFFPKGFDDKFGKFFKRPTEECTELHHPLGVELVYNPEYMIECNEDEDYVVCELVFYCADGNIKKGYRKSVLPVELTNFLQPELKNSLNLTNKALLQKDSIESQKILIDTLLSIMVLIIENDVPSISLKKYIPLCQSLLVEYIQKVEQNHPSLISKEKTSYSKYLTPKNPTENHFLKMKTSQFNRLPVLLDALKTEGFVEKNLPLETFQKAFDGSIIETPLGIKWIKIYYSRYYYGSALELIQQLEKKKYIPEFSYKQLSNIFVQGDGTPITEEGWKEVKYRKGKAKKGRNDILEDIEAMVKSF